jgi:hypothetical protein
MSIFDSILNSIGDGIQGVDKAINKINPMKGPMQDLTDATVSKVYKPAGNLYDLSNSHPIESLVAMSLASAAWTGGAAAFGGAGAGAGAGGAAAGGAAGGGTAMGGAAGTLGATDSAAASAELGLTAADVGGTSGATAGAGSAAGAGAGASSSWWDYGKTAAKALGPSLVNAAMQPKPPKTKAPTAMPDPLAEEQAQRQKLIEQLSRRGRASTVLTSASNGSLGG